MKLVASLALIGVLSVSASSALAHDYSTGCPKLTYMAPKSVVETCAAFDEAKQRMKEADQVLDALLLWNATLLTAMRDIWHCLKN